MCMSTPTVQPVAPPPPAASPPTMADPSVSASGASARARAAAAYGAGYGNTLRTGGQGLTDPVSAAQKSLLGQ